MKFNLNQVLYVASECISHEKTSITQLILCCQIYSFTHDTFSLSWSIIPHVGMSCVILAETVTVNDSTGKPNSSALLHTATPPTGKHDGSILSEVRALQWKQYTRILSEPFNYIFPACRTSQFPWGKQWTSFSHKIELNVSWVESCCSRTAGGKISFLYTKWTLPKPYKNTALTPTLVQREKKILVRKHCIAIIQAIMCIPLVHLLYTN